MHSLLKVSSLALLLVLDLANSFAFDFDSEVECLSITSASECENKKPCGCEWSREQKCTCGAAAPLDIVFALDSSKSLGEDNFDISVDWVVDFIKTSLPDDVRVGLIVFANDAVIKLYFQNVGFYANNDAIAAAVQTAATFLTTQFTDIPDAITKMYEIYQHAEDNLDPVDTECKMFILLTDGRTHLGEDGANNPMDLDTFCELDETVEIKNDNEIETFVIGLGSDWSPSFVECMIPDDKQSTNILKVEDDTYTVDKINSYVLEQLTKKSCQCPDTFAPTGQPTMRPTKSPTDGEQQQDPTEEPVEDPTEEPTPVPTEKDEEPTEEPSTTVAPSVVPTVWSVPTVSSLSQWHSVNIGHNGNSFGECLEECNFSPCMCFETGSCCDCDERFGCNKCKDGYFQMSRNHRCVSCEDVFGTECMECNDGIGCVKCQMGYKLVYDKKCDVWHCQSVFECPMKNHMWYKYEM